MARCAAATPVFSAMETPVPLGGCLSGRAVGVRRRVFHGADYAPQAGLFLQSLHRITQVFHAIRVDG